ncbi:MAG: hypothetical protein ACI4E1_11835 [Lachnospira sp.]
MDLTYWYMVITKCFCLCISGYYFEGRGYISEGSKLFKNVDGNNDVLCTHRCVKKGR